MKKILPILLVLVIFLEFNLSAFSQIKPPFGGGLGSKVSATVGEFYLNLSGYISPFASVILSVDGIFIRATTADENGNFNISQVLIKKGFSHFCLEAIDSHNLGKSYTCFTIPPAEGSVTMKDIFLPPTLALAKNSIPEGESTKAYGYTMPGAKVTLYLSNNTTLTTTADENGYYEFILKNLKAGKYTIYARANYKNIDSLAPSRKLDLTVLSKTGQLIVTSQSLWDRFLKFLSSLSLGPLWLVIPIIILIIILIVKLWPGKFSFIFRRRLPTFIPLFKRSKHPLHHNWWVGY